MSNHFSTIQTKSGKVIDLFAYKEKGEILVGYTIDGHSKRALPPLGGEDLEHFTNALGLVKEGIINSANGIKYKNKPPK